MTSQRLKILFIDDDPECLQGYLSALEPANYRCTITTNPGRALALYANALAEDPFDVVVTDVRMPGMTGIELLKKIKGIDEQARIIIITAFGDHDIARTVVDYDVYACFGKPLQFRDLVDTFQQIEREEGYKS